MLVFLILPRITDHYTAITRQLRTAILNRVLQSRLRPAGKPLQLRTVLPVVLLWLALPAWGGINKKLVVNPDTPDGKFLELISLETDYDKRLALIEQFTKLFPQSESIGWAWAQIQESSLSDGQWDKTIQAGDKLLDLDAEDLEAARLNLQAAQGKDDKELIRKYTALGEKIAQKVMTNRPAPEDPADAAAQKRRAEIASGLLAQREYALYDQAFSTTDPRKKIGTLDQLLQLNPHTRYLNDALLIYFLAYKQLNDAPKALAAAEKLLQRDQSHEDALLYVADYLFRRKQDGRRVLEYCDRIVALMNNKRKPTGVSEGEWAYQKALYTGTAYYMAGSVHINEDQYEPADRSLRAALPYLRGNNSLLPAALNALAWANYQLSRYTEAVRFYKQCLPFGGLYKEQAEKNLAAIKAEHNVEEE